MKYIGILALIMLTMVSAPMQAQTFEQKLAKAEKIKERKGEMNDKYLDALSEAIQIAFGAKDYETANKYRLIHMDIVKQKFGDNSLEYAEDLWRLGNVSSYKGEDYTFACYQKAGQIYELNNATDAFPYGSLMVNEFIYYNNTGNPELALTCILNAISTFSNWLGKEWKGNRLFPESYALYHMFLGELYEYKLSDTVSALEAYEKCDNLLDRFKVKETFDYTEHLYLDLTILCGKMERYDKQIFWGDKWAEVIKNTYGEFSKNYIDAIGSSRYFYWNAGDVDGAINVSRQYVNLISNSLDSLNVNPRTDSLYISAVESLGMLYGSIQNYSGVIETASELKDICIDAQMTETDVYIHILEDLILAYYHTGDYDDFLTVGNEYESLLKKYDATETEGYCSYLGLKVEILTFLNKETEYQKVYKELAALTEKLYDKNSYKNLILIYQKANKEAIVDNYSAAKNTLAGCYDILNSGVDIFENKSDSLIIMAHIHQMEANILSSENNPETENRFKLAIREFEESGVDNAAVYTNLGVYYYTNKKLINKALECFGKSREILENKGDTVSVNYFTVLNNIGLCYKDLGKYNKAINAFNYTAYSVEQSCGKNHPLYALTLQNMSTFYFAITDYESAIRFGEEAKDIIEIVYGRESEKYAVILQNLGMYYEQIRNHSRAEEYLLSSIDLFHKASGDSNPNLIYPYVNLLEVYGVQGKFDEFDEIDRTCKDILLTNGLFNTTDAASYYCSIAYIYSVYNNPRAKDYYIQALSLIGELGLEGSPDYLVVNLYYALSCCIDGTPEESLSISLAEMYRQQYLSNYAYFNKAERESLISGNRYLLFKNVLFTTPSSDSYNTSLFDFLLFNKGLLLGTSSSFAESVYSSGDDALISKYNRLMAMTNVLDGKQSQDDSLRNFTEEDIRKESSLLEREITTQLQRTGNYLSDINMRYEDVVDALSAKDVAIEFVLYKDYRDTDKYAALVARKGWQVPKFVQLGNKDEVDKLISNKPSQLYSSGFISSELFGLLWTPLEEYLSPGDNVYFSPDGCLYQFALEQLIDGKNRRLCEKYNMTRCSSTKVICNRRNSHSYNKAVLYGGLRYDETEQIMVDASRNYTVSTFNSNGLFELTRSNGTRRGWDYLPGTLSEVTDISLLLNKANVTNIVYSESEGNEESFKALSGEDISILHLATHGFYIPESDAEKHSFTASNPFSPNAISAASSSMNRSGLLMSGGNNAWIGGSAPDGVEDGVLTASEISDMNLNSVDLLVLSACETGLGEITDDGVIGLQRAFKNAGVGTIVMSLWAVDDQATSLMMETFYKNLLSGKPKRDAFKIAQKTVRSQYEDPSYWASFIMLD